MDEPVFEYGFSDHAPAFCDAHESHELGLEIGRETRKRLSFNINAYLDTFVKNKSKGITTGKFIHIIAETMDRIVSEMGKKSFLSSLNQWILL